MSLILYPYNETSFDSNGIGILSDVVDDEVYEELNGQFELTVQYPVTGIHFAEIVADAYITAKPNPVSDPQPFRIYRITKPMKGIVTIYARHMAYRNHKIVVAPFTAVSAISALQGLKNNAVNACPFEFWTDKTTEATMEVKEPKAVWTLLGGSKGSILDTYGGEYEFDKYTVKLHNRRGADRGVSIRYGKNLTDLKQDESVANVYTGIYPYWKDSEGTLMQLPEKIVKGPGTYFEDKILPVDLTEKFEEQPTEDQLREAAERYISSNDIGKPDISWTVEFVQLEQTEEYKGKALLERVLLGDTVSVMFPMVNVNVSARAVAARYKPTLGRYKNITLGKVKANMASTVAAQKQEIQQKPTMSQLEQAREAATAWLTNGKGYKVERRDADGNTIDTLYMDTPDINTAVNVLRIGQSGIGFSHTGVNGPYISAWTIDGKFNADMILTGTLFGILIKACRIESANGKISIDFSDETATPIFNTGISTNGINVRADVTGAEKLFRMEAMQLETGDYYGRMIMNSVDGQGLFDMYEMFNGDLTERVGVLAKWKSKSSDIAAIIEASDDITGFWLYNGESPVGGVCYSGGELHVLTQKLNGKTISWGELSDGTCVLIGT